MSNYLHGRLDQNERFRERRRQARSRRRRRRAGAVVLLCGAGAGIALGATFIGRDSGPAAAPAAAKRQPAVAGASGPRRQVPDEIRGIHVTMALASLPGKLDQYIRLRAFGLNTIELDVKDENGKVGFVEGAPALARAIGAARPYYDARDAAIAIHNAGLYLVGRVVVFEDPTLSAARPSFAVKRPDGSLWRNNAGLGWTNPYDSRVWRYNLAIAEAAARAGFDEIQFDYVRFPSDGDLSAIVYPRTGKLSKGRTIERFLANASRRLRPLGVRLSADLFGLAATRDLGIGQVPRWLARHVDALYPMVYPSHYVPGEYNLVDPEAYPGRTVARSLVDYKRAVKRRTRLVPWLQDFSLRRKYTLSEVTDQVAAARRQHAAGFMLWNPNGLYTEEALAGPSG
jgi:hypothetical protein